MHSIKLLFEFNPKRRQPVNGREARMADILRDPMWQFVAVILAILAILTTCILYLKQRPKKALSYEILSQVPLLSVEEEVTGRVEILFDKKPVQQVHLVEIRLVNSGNVPIEANEFECPVNLSFGDEAEIFTAEVTETTPKSLRAEVVFEKKIAVLQPTLLNEGDSIKLKMLVAKFAKVNLDGRIVGVKEIGQFIEKRTRYLVFIATGMIVNFCGFLFVLLGPTPTPLIQSFVGVITVLAGGILALFYVRKL